MKQESTGTRVHQVEQHRLAYPGLSARTLLSNHHFPRHSHDEYAIGVIDQGAQRSWSSIGKVEAHAGDAIMANPGEIHDGEPIAGQARHWRMIYFDPRIVSKLSEEEELPSVQIIRPSLRDSRLTALINRLFLASTGDPVPDLLDSTRLAVEERLLQLLRYVMAQHVSNNVSVRGPSPKVARALDRLDSAPELPISLGELAALSNVSRFQLLRGFVRDVGLTPHGYLMQRRVRLAQQLLARGCSPAHVAAAAGFSDQSHLTRQFQRYTGITPARYQAAVT